MNLCLLRHMQQALILKTDVARPPAGASANVQLKCKGCDRKHEIMLRPHLPANGWSAHSSEEWQRLATFEIRGMEAVESEVRDGFIVEAMDGTKYEDGSLFDIIRYT
jgi:hypothetical protein